MLRPAAVILEEILAELKAQRAYTVERDLRLDAEDEEDRQRKARNDAAMFESLEMQKHGLKLAEGLKEGMADPLKRYETPEAKQ